MNFIDAATTVLSLPRPELIASDGAEPDAELLKRHKITSDEYSVVRSIMGRAPTFAELGVFSAMWSEHCSYKSSRVHLKRFPTEGDQVVVGPGENAGVVRLRGKICAAFKMESHNHPSYIEPYQGAATGVGGILRDVFCMGARPFANLNCLRFGERRHERTSYLVPRVVKGIGDYGNCVGVPTVGGSVSYDRSYNGNCLVNAMTVGLIDEDKIFKGFASGVGNLVVYVGSATGRDGIHGATMASDEFSTKNVQSKTTVQVGDPFAEKLLMEATLEVLSKNLVVGIQDMGAAGLTSSSFEMAGRAGNGIFIDLDLVPVRTDKMTAYEIMLSESQERMLMVVEPSRYNELERVLSHWGLRYAAIGVVTDSGRVHAVKSGKLEIDIPVAPLTDEAPVYHKKISAKAHAAGDHEIKNFAARMNGEPEFALKIMSDVIHDIGSKQKIFRQFDRHIGNRTVLGPEAGGAAVMWIHEAESEGDPWLGVAISSGCNERKVKNNPTVGAAEAVLARAREITATGGIPLATTDCLNFGSADDPDVMRDFSESVDGISVACAKLNSPVVSGNVSLYNTTAGTSIYPTPMIGMIGLVKDIRNAAPATIDGCHGERVIYLLRADGSQTDHNDLTAGAAAKCGGVDVMSGVQRPVDWGQELTAMGHIQELIGGGCVVSCRAVSDGGVMVAAFKMARKLLEKGMTLDLSGHTPTELLGEKGARYLISTDLSLTELRSKITDDRVSVTVAGKVVSDGASRIITDCGSISAKEILSRFETSNDL